MTKTKGENTPLLGTAERKNHESRSTPKPPPRRQPETEQFSVSSFQSGYQSSGYEQLASTAPRIEEPSALTTFNAEPATTTTTTASAFGAPVYTEPYNAIPLSEAVATTTTTTSTTPGQILQEFVRAHHNKGKHSPLSDGEAQSDEENTGTRRRLKGAHHLQKERHRREHNHTEHYAHSAEHDHKIVQQQSEQIPLDTLINMPNREALNDVLKAPDDLSSSEYLLKGAENFADAIKKFKPQLSIANELQTKIWDAESEDDDIIATTRATTAIATPQAITRQVVSHLPLISANLPINFRGTTLLDEILSKANPPGLSFPATNTRMGHPVPSNTIQITSLRDVSGLKLVLLGPGRRWLPNPDHSYLDKSINLSDLQRTGLFEYRDETASTKSDTLTIVHVQAGENGYALKDGQPVTLGEGWHIYNSSQFEYLFSIDKTNGNVTKKSSINREFDPTQKVQRVGAITQLPVPTTALVARPEPTTAVPQQPRATTAQQQPRIATPATTAPTEADTINATSNATCIQLGSTQQIIVPPGYIGLALNAREPVFLSSGTHDLSSQVKLTGIVPSNFKYFRHGNLAVFQVQPGEHAIGVKNGNSELFGPGIYVRDIIADQFNLEAIFSDNLLEHDIVSRNLTITRVPVTTVRLSKDNSLPEMLGPGIHIRKSNAFELHQIEPQTEAEFSEGNLHVRRVKAGEWGIAEFSNGIVELLEPGVHIIDDPAFKWIRSIPQNLTEPFSYGTLHLIPVPPGKLALVTIDNRSVVLGSTPSQGTLHCIDSVQVTFNRYEDFFHTTDAADARPHVIHHGTVTIADIPKNYIAFAMDGPTPIRVEPGLHAWDSQQFTLKEEWIFPATNKLINFNNFTYATVDTGEVGVYYHDGILDVLEPGRYDPDHDRFKDKRISFAGWLSTGREQFREPLELVVNTAETTGMKVSLNMEYQIAPEHVKQVIATTRSSLSGDADIGRNTAALAKLIESKIKTLALTTLSSIMKEYRYSEFVEAASQLMGDRPQISESARSADAGAITVAIDKRFQELFKETLKQAGITLVTSSLFKFEPEDGELRKKFQDQIAAILEQRQELQRLEQRNKILLSQQQTAEAEARIKAIQASTEARTQAEIQVVNAKRDADIARTKAEQNTAIEAAKAQQAAQVAEAQAKQQAAVAVAQAQQEAEVAKAKAARETAQATALAEQENLRETKKAERESQVALIQAEQAMKVAQLKLQTAQLEAQTKKLEAETALAIAQSQAAQQELTVKVNVLEYKLRLEAETASRIQYMQGLSAAMTPDLARVFEAKSRADALVGLKPNITVNDQTQLGAINEVLTSALRGSAMPGPSFWQQTQTNARRPVMIPTGTAERGIDVQPTASSAQDAFSGIDLSLPNLDALNPESIKQAAMASMTANT